MEISFDFSAFQKNLRNLIDSHGITVFLALPLRSTAMSLLR